MSNKGIFGILLLIGIANATISNTAATTNPTGNAAPANVSWIAGYCNATTNQPNNIGYNYTWYLNGAVNSSGVYSTLLTGTEIGTGRIFYNESGFTDGDLANDSDYSTHSSYTDFGSVSAYWNYTRPANSTNVTKWQVKHGTSSHVTDNTTLTAGCANQTIIQLKITANNSNTSGSGASGNSSKNGTAFSDGASVGTITWSNPTYANKSDNIHANASITTLATTHYLNASNFGFAIPTDATITGIRAAIEKKSNTKAVIYDVDVYLLKAGATTGTNMKNATVWQTADATTLYGGSTNLWGTTWTPAEINAATFGLVISANNTGARSAIASVDYMYLTVYYNTSSATTNYSRTSKFCKNDFGWTAIGIDSNATNNFSASDIYEQDLFFNTASGGNASGQQVMVSNITPTIAVGQRWILQCTAFDSTTENYNSSELVITNCGCGIYATPNYVCNMDTNLAQSATCFNITATNVTINGNGFSITGAGVPTAIGISTTAENTTIRNAKVSGFITGIYLDGANGSMITNSNTTTTTGIGIRLLSVTNCNITNSNGTATGAVGDGIRLTSSTGNTFTGTTASGWSGKGISIISGSGNTFTNTAISTTSGYALSIDNSDNNIFTGLTTNTSLGTSVYLSGADNTTFTNMNATANTGSGKYAVHLASGTYNTFTNLNATSSSSYTVKIDAAGGYTTITNSWLRFINTTTVSSDPLIIASSFNNISNTYATSNGLQSCVWIFDGDNNTLTNITMVGTGTLTKGFSITQTGSGNTLRNSTITTSGTGNQYAIAFSQATDNEIIDNVVSAFNTSLIGLTTSSHRNLFRNNTLISMGGEANLTYFLSGANNTFCLNNFTATTGVYINDKSTTTSNQFNCTYEGKNQGNIYANVMNGSVEINGTENSSIPGLYIGSSGTGYPYSNTTSMGKIIGNAVDYAPLTPFFGIPIIGSCIYGGSGDWWIELFDNCNLTINTDVGENTIYFNGSGSVGFGGSPELILTSRNVHFINIINPTALFFWSDLWINATR